MNNYKFLGAAALFVLFVCYVLSAPSKALACACCADAGQYSIHTGKASSYQIDLLKAMKFSATVNLFETAGEGNIKGLSNDSNSFSLIGGFANNQWKLNFKDDKGKTGTLVLPLLTTVLEFKADIHDGKEGGGGGPLLYKEWRFKGKVVNGTGVFQAGIVNPTTYFLVFQGRGNNCDNAEDFTHWRVEINGKKSDYAFYGEMASSNPKH